MFGTRISKLHTGKWISEHALVMGCVGYFPQEERTTLDLFKKKDGDENKALDPLPWIKTFQRNPSNIDPKSKLGVFLYTANSAAVDPKRYLQNTTNQLFCFQKKKKVYQRSFK